MTELPPAVRAKIASKAQAEAHRSLREAHPDEYAKAYQDAKAELTAKAERRQTAGKT